MQFAYSFSLWARECSCDSYTTILWRRWPPDEATINKLEKDEVIVFAVESEPVGPYENTRDEIPGVLRFGRVVFVSNRRCSA